jgi:hypothetical protein
MHQLHIALRNGFGGHEVAIGVNGSVVYSARNVTTDLRISRADSLDVDVTRPRVRLDVTVSPPGKHASREIDVVAYPAVAIDVKTDGAIAIAPLASAPRYM